MILGIDLSATSRRNTGYAFFDGNRIIAGTIHYNREIIQMAKEFDYIFIDAPLSLPKNNVGYRECDRMLIRMGIRVFPANFKSMKILTERGLRIKYELEKLSKKVYEVFPTVLYKMAYLNKNDIEGILKLYNLLGYELENRKYNRDEIDAIACLIIGSLYISGKGLEIVGKDGIIIIPKFF